MECTKTGRKAADIPKFARSSTNRGQTSSVCINSSHKIESQKDYVDWVHKHQKKLFTDKNNKIPQVSISFLFFSERQKKKKTIWYFLA